MKRHIKIKLFMCMFGFFILYSGISVPFCVYAFDEGYIADYDDPASEAEAYFQEAKILLEQARFKDARDRLIRVLELDPTHRLASIYLEQIEAVIVQGIDMEKEVVNDRITQQKEKEHVAETLVFDQGKVKSMYNRGRYLYKSEDYESALALFKKVLEIDPEHRGAFRYFKKTSELLARSAKPKIIDIPSEVEQSAEKDGVDEKKTPVLIKAKEEADDEQAALFKRLLGKGISQYEEKKYFGAIASLEAALEVKPDSAQAQEYLSLAKAAQEYEQKSLQEALSRNYASQDDTQKVAISAKPGTYLEETPAPVRAYTPFEKRQIRKAVTEFEMKMHMEKAEAFFKEKDYGKAIEHINKVLVIAPDNEDALRMKEKSKELLDRQMAGIMKAKQEAEEDALKALNLEKKRRALKAKALSEERRRAEIKKRQDIERRRQEFIAQRNQDIEDEIKRRKERISQLFDNAEILYKAEEYDKAEAFIDSILEEDPNNKKAEEFLHMLAIAKLDKAEAENRKEIEVNEHKMLMQVSEKNKVSDKLLKDGISKCEDKQPEPQADERRAVKEVTKDNIYASSNIREKMEQLVTLDFKDVDLVSVINYLSDVTGVNIIASSSVNVEEHKATIRVKNMPFKDALKYLLKSLGLKYRIDKDAVWVATADEMHQERLETRVYSLDKGIHSISKLSDLGGGSVMGLGQEQGETEVKNIKDLLEEAVDLPKGAKFTLDERTGSLIVTNTSSNLQTVEQILSTLDMKPVQILIETRFVEVNVTDLEQLGIDAHLNSPWGVTQNDESPDANKIQIDGDSGVNFSDFASRNDEGFNLTLRGVLSQPQLEITLHALKEKANLRTLSSPRITTLNNQPASIQVVRDYIYPTRYEISYVEDENNDGVISEGEGDFLNLPQDFVTRKVGIILKVTPTVGCDKSTITLSLVPEVSDFSQNDSFGNGVTLPRFTSRSLTTSVAIKNSETVVLGGLISETNTQSNSKVPVLNKIPLLGKAFKKKSGSVERKNLLIFVTAKIIDIDSVDTSKEDSIL